MTYVDALFYCFFVALVVIVRLVLRDVRFREWLIIAASLVFLATWGHVSLFVFCGVLAVNYAATIAIERTGERPSRYVLILIISCDLLALAYFKYFNFVMDSLSAIA